MAVFKRIRKNKDGSRTAYWYTRIMINGKDKWESVGKVGEVTKAVAQRREEEIKRKIRRGLYDYEDDITLADLEDDYIKHIKDTRQLRTWSKRQRHYQTLKHFFKDKTFNQITPRDIEDFKLFRIKSVKPASVNRELETLRHVINLAKRWKRFYGENPVSVAGLMTANNQRDRVLSVEEEQRLLANSAPHLKVILAMALNTGMRKGEILSLTWNSIDFDNNLFIINASNNKSKKLKKVPINSYLKTMLLELKMRNSRLINSEKIEHVFLGDDHKPVKEVKTAFRNACKRAKIEGLRFHDLRHTAGTRMLERGVNIVAISEILGHSSIETTRKRYLHPDNTLRDAVEKLASFEQSCSQNSSHHKFENS
jgi:integrase